jgi:predicted enzyme related to lactoylglutathione lyase
MLRGMATVSYYADDIEAATRWYSELLGVEPYFSRPVEGPPAYVEFRIGDYQAELGIIDRRHAPAGAANGPGGEIVFWAVDDLAATVDRLIAMGAKEYEPITERGPGFVTASVVDPFGNVLGVMTNVHYLEIVNSHAH